MSRTRGVDSLPLPALTMADRVAITFTDEQAEMADDVIAAIAGRTTWSNRVAIAGHWLLSNAKADDGGNLFDCVRMLAAYLKTLREPAITSADQAGFYMVCSNVEEQRGVAGDWLMTYGGVDRWYVANPGFAAAMHALHRRSVRTGLGHMEPSA